MSLTAHIAQHFREIHFGGNWTSVNLRDQLTDLDWQLATKQIYGLNTIVALAYHLQYYVGGVLQVLEGGTLDIRDKYSFAHPTIRSQTEWENFLSQCWADAERFAGLVAQLPESRLWEDFVDPRYGNYYRNLHGLIEHSHYHLGQIVLLKKFLLQSPQT